MDIQIKQGDFTQTQADALIIFTLQDRAADTVDTLATVNGALDGMITELVEAGDISGKTNEATVLYTRGAIPAKRVIVVGLGKTDAVSVEALRQAASTGMKKARDVKAAHVATMATGLGFELEAQTAAQAIAEGSVLGLYRYHGQKNDDQPPALPAMLTLITDEATLEGVTAGVQMGQAFAAGTVLARDLANLPPNYCTPSYLADTAVTMANEVGLSVKVLEREQMRALKMGALLAVAQGSDAPPRFIILEHNADKADDENVDTLVLVGKGVTFDTGGYSLKTRDGMIGMKGDMGGGAAVIGAMKTIAMLNVPLHVVGLVPASDNMVSGGAYRPQEVITASNGKTIEIISTDAEGRMLLADALVYAGRYQPKAVVDIATLTGGAVVALGDAAAAVFSKDDALSAALVQAGANVHERVWPMPLFDEYKKQLESDTADMKNSGGRGASACTAATFLKNFTDDYTAWAHVDMAGMMASDGKPYSPKGMSGFGARLLAEWVRQSSS